MLPVGKCSLAEGGNIIIFIIILLLLGRITVLRT